MRDTEFPLRGLTVDQQAPPQPSQPQQPLTIEETLAAILAEQRMLIGQIAQLEKALGRVKVADFGMSFWSLVTFMIKVAIAAIPAAIFLAIMLAIMWFAAGGFLVTFFSNITKAR